MAITLTTSTLVPSVCACLRNASPLKSGPVGNVGMVSETTRPGLADSSWLIAWNRVLLVAVSAIAAPSMSKSMWLMCSVFITDWYADSSWLRLVQDWASSTPSAPPNETIGVAPSDSALLISPLTVGSFVTGSVSPQIGVQPDPITNAAVNAFRPALVAAWSSIGS